MKRATALVFVMVTGCGTPARDHVDGGGSGSGIDAQTADAVDGAPACATPATPAGATVQLASPYDTLYKVYDLGVVPGVPDPLGGTVIQSAGPDTLLVAGGSESTSGAIYAIHVERACGHIIGFTGTATQVASTPYVDANLVYANSNLLLYSEWPEYTLSQLAGSAATPSRSTDLRTLGMPTTDMGPGGLGMVPPGLTGAGELRMVTWPGGDWYHVTTAPDAGMLAVSAITKAVTIPNNPGGFAYVPMGSPGFPNQSVIVAEWREDDATKDRVAIYDVDANGDPTLNTRREFFLKFPRPWGAYFEPVTGDYIFLSWGSTDGPDHMYIVEGFVPPPPIL